MKFVPNITLKSSFCSPILGRRVDQLFKYCDLCPSGFRFVMNTEQSMTAEGEDTARQLSNNCSKSNRMIDACDMTPANDL